MPKTSTELRSFVIGCIAGIFIMIGSFVAISEIAGIKWQPIAVSRR